MCLTKLVIIHHQMSWRSAGSFIGFRLTVNQKISNQVQLWKVWYQILILYVLYMCNVQNLANSCLVYTAWQWFLTMFMNILKLLIFLNRELLSSQKSCLAYSEKQWFWFVIMNILKSFNFREQRTFELIFLLVLLYTDTMNFVTTLLKKEKIYNVHWLWSTCRTGLAVPDLQTCLCTISANVFLLWRWKWWSNYRY